jgi:RNA polymerase sigma-70 factor (ECF subfamily)
MAALLLIMANEEYSKDRSYSMQMLFEQAYEKYYQIFYAYFFGRTSDKEAAQDLLQETFLRVWRHCQSLQELTDEQQRAWMFTIARNLLIDYYRHRATRSAAEDEFAQFALPSPGTQNDMDALVGEMEQVAQLDLAIKRLPEELRTVLVLGTLAGMSSTEIGAMLGKPAGTVRYQMAKARKKLAEALHLFVPDFYQKEDA